MDNDAVNGCIIGLAAGITVLVAVGLMWGALPVVLVLGSMTFVVAVRNAS